MSMGLIAAFSMPVFFRNIDKFVMDKEKQATMGLAYIGEKFVNDARDNGTYEDRTSNLRGSIAYDVVKNAKSLVSDYSGGGKGDEESKNASQKAVDDVIVENSLWSDNVIWLIGVAGMEYASAVESKKYDVITASAPEESDIKALMRDAGIVGDIV